MVFPLRYRGAFERDPDIGHDHRAGRRALSRQAREMLELKLAPETASKLIDCIERMTAAAANSHDDG